jgi:ribonuclease-3
MKIQLTETEISNLTEFAEKELKVTFKNLSLLHGALIHRSYLNEVRTSGIEHNERLEFLGDAVLELISTEYLFEEYPNRPEGELTSFRAALVRTES